jgi:hypothetical protein
LSIFVASAQQPSLPIQDLQILRLWSGAAPGAQGTGEGDIPQMTVYLPRSNATDMTAVIVLPGGGYRALSMNSEGVSGELLEFDGNRRVLCNTGWGRASPPG